MRQLFTLAIAAVPFFAYGMEPEAPPVAPATSVALQPNTSAMLASLLETERLLLESAEQHGALHSAAMQRRTYLEQNRESMLKNAVDWHLAMARHYESLQKDALQRAEYLKDHDAEMFQQALALHDADAAEQTTLKEDALQRAERARDLRLRLERLAAGEQRLFLEQHSQEVVALTSPFGGADETRPGFPDPMTSLP